MLWKAVPIVKSHWRQHEINLEKKKCELLKLIFKKKFRKI